MDAKELRLEFNSLDDNFPQDSVHRVLKEVRKGGKEGFIACASIQRKCLAIAAKDGTCILSKRRARGNQREVEGGATRLRRLPDLGGQVTAMVLVGLLPSESVKTVWFPGRRNISFGMILNGSLVSGIKHGSPADSRGVRVGWRITSIASYQVSNDSESINQILASLRSSPRIAFTFSLPPTRSTALLIGLSTGGVSLLSTQTGKPMTPTMTFQIHPSPVVQIVVQRDDADRNGATSCRPSKAYVLFLDGLVASLEISRTLGERNREIPHDSKSEAGWTVKHMLYNRKDGGEGMVSSLTCAGNPSPGFRRFLESERSPNDLQLAITGQNPLLESYTITTLQTPSKPEISKKNLNNLEEKSTENPGRRARAAAAVASIVGGVLSGISGIFSEESGNEEEKRGGERRKMGEDVIRREARVEFDPRRSGLQVTSDPSGCLLAVSDSVARVTIWDASRVVAIRWFKGYRKAQCGWIRNSRGLYLAIYASYRGLLEVWGILGEDAQCRVGARSVGTDAVLLYSNHLGSPECLLIRGDGRVAFLSIDSEVVPTNSAEISAAESSGSQSTKR